MDTSRILTIIQNHLDHIEKGATKLHWEDIPLSITTYKVLGNLIRIDIKSAIPEDKTREES